MATLTVKVLETRGLPEAPYTLSISNSGRDKKSTPTIKAANPKWSETFNFPIASASEQWELRLALKGTDDVTVGRLRAKESDVVSSAPLWYAFDRPTPTGSIPAVQLQISKKLGSPQGPSQQLGSTSDSPLSISSSLVVPTPANSRSKSPGRSGRGLVSSDVLPLKEKKEKKDKSDKSPRSSRRQSFGSAIEAPVPIPTSTSTSSTTTTTSSSHHHHSSHHQPSHPASANSSSSAISAVSSNSGAVPSSSTTANSNTNASSNGAGGSTTPSGSGIRSSGVRTSGIIPKKEKKEKKEKDKKEKKKDKAISRQLSNDSTKGPEGATPTNTEVQSSRSDSSVSSKTQPQAQPATASKLPSPPTAHPSTSATSTAPDAPSQTNSQVQSPTEPHMETRKQPADALLLPQLTQKFKSIGSATLTHSWEIDAKELEFVKELGEGTSAKVFSGLYRGQEVAIKVLKDKITDKQILDDWAAEFNIMSMIRSPSVVFFFGATLTPMLAIVLELCHKGSLFDAMNSPDERDSFTWARSLKITEASLKGIVCLHGWKPQIVHRDLKSLNLLIDDNWNVKVGDFGLSRFTSGTSGMSTLGKLRGTYAYCAPEVYFGQPYSTKADIFSMAIIFWEIVCRCMTREYQQPYAEFPNLMFPFQIIIQTAKNNQRPTIPKGVPASIVSLLQKAWDGKPEERPSAIEFLERVRLLQKEYEANKDAWDKLIAEKPFSLKDGLGDDEKPPERPAGFFD